MLRYANLYGPGTASPGKGGDLLEQVRGRKLPIIGDGAGVWSFVHVDDAAGATSPAVEHGAPGVYNVADDEPGAGLGLAAGAGADCSAPSRRAACPAWLAGSPRARRRFDVHPDPRARRTPRPSASSAGRSPSRAGATGSATGSPQPRARRRPIDAAGRTRAMAELAEGGRIDVHQHFIPAEVVDIYHRLGMRQLAGLAIPEVTSRQTLWFMDKDGIETALLSLADTGPAFTREEDAIEISRRTNDRYAELRRDHPGRFGAFAALPLPHLDAAQVELERALDELGLDGVMLLSNRREREIDVERGETLDEQRQSGPHGRLAAGQADRREPEAIDQQASDSFDLLERQQLGTREPVHPLGRHAVRATQVAPVGHRDAQVSVHPAVAVDEGLRSRGSGYRAACSEIAGDDHRDLVAGVDTVAVGQHRQPVGRRHRGELVRALPAGGSGDADVPPFDRRRPRGAKWVLPSGGGAAAAPATAVEPGTVEVVGPVPVICRSAGRASSS